MSSLDPIAIQVIAHPPERRRQRSGAPAQAGQCCCCCCCCLHTIGGLIGAAVAPTVGPSRSAAGPRNAEEDDYADHYWDPRRGRPGPVRSGVSAVALFWLSTLALGVIGTGIAVLMAAGGDPTAIYVWLFGLALGLPALQLAACIPPALYFAFSNRPDKWIELGQLGRALAGLLLGTVAGVVVMVGIGVVLRAL